MAHQHTDIGRQRGTILKFLVGIGYLGCMQVGKGKRMPLHVIYTETQRHTYQKDLPMTYIRSIWKGSQLDQEVSGS